MNAPLTLLYTQRIRGNLSILPRLYTFLRTLHAPHGEKTLMVDLGESCAPDVWPCGVTGGRAALLVLDAMGYTAAHVSSELAPEDYAKLAGQVSLALIDDAHPHTQGGALFATQPSPTHDGLQILLHPADQTMFIDSRLTLQAVESGQVGIVRLDGTAITRAVSALPPETPPDPTVTAVVDLVEEEARYYERRR